MDENEKLKMLAETKSDQVSIMAHQIRTSLTAFKWSLRMFINGELGDINDEQKNHLNRIINNNEYTLSLINDLLKINHSKEISITMNPKPTNLIETIDKVLVLFLGESKNKNIKIIFNKPEGNFPIINCDEKMVIIALQNLIENAIKYGDNNTDIIISLALNNEENNVLLSINNKGVKIGKEDEENIFSKFFRAQKAIEKDESGFGIGLFATKNIIEKHRGKIWFDSKDEAGTTFFVLLPIS